MCYWCESLATNGALQKHRPCSERWTCERNHTFPQLSLICSLKRQLTDGFSAAQFGLSIFPEKLNKVCSRPLWINWEEKHWKQKLPSGEKLCQPIKEIILSSNCKGSCKFVIDTEANLDSVLTDHQPLLCVLKTFWAAFSHSGLQLSTIMAPCIAP